MAMLLLWILSLAASFLLPATGEVVGNFKSCNQFFLDEKPPNLEPDKPAKICQLYANNYRFATMYNRDMRIPMFSAYRYEPHQGGREDNWMIEPQLALPKGRKSMESEETCGINPEKLKISQAVRDDYREGALYDKGHMLPPSHQLDAANKAATFTLTNIVPQLRELNAGQWRIYEENINREGCQRTYVIVGAVPGKKFINNRVNVPSHIWAAGCCVNANNHRRPWAVIAENDKDKVDYITLSELQTKLATLYRKEKVDLFNSRCRKIKNRAHQANESKVQT